MFRKSPNTSGRFNRQARCSLASRNRRRSIQRTPLTFERFEDRQLLATFAEFVDPNPSSGNRFGQSVVPLETGNVVITSPADDAGGTDAGAVYLFNGSTGALISTLTGSSPGDLVGSTGVVALEGGNYVVRSSAWANGSAVNAGAVTFGDGETGVSGVVSEANSLVGAAAFDRVGHDGGLSRVAACRFWSDFGATFLWNPTIFDGNPSSWAFSGLCYVER